MPVYPSNLIRVTHKGVLNGGEETFQFGLWLRAVSAPASDDAWNVGLGVLAAQLEGHFETLWPDIDQLISADADMVSIHVAHVGTDGRYLHAAEVGLETAPGSSNPGLPWEVACVVSLWGYAEGLFVPNRNRKRGRFYLPPLGTSAMTTGGLFAAATCNTIADWAQALTGLYNASDFGVTGPDVDLVIPNAVEGTYVGLNRVSVGNVPDAQRRRRKSQGETRYVP